MPPFLCPSPIILDHSFPRDEDALKIASGALGELVALAERGAVNLLLTPVLKEIVQEFNTGSGARPYALISDLYALLTQWVLQPNDHVTWVDVSDIGDHIPHPIPASCNDDGLVVIWADEIGRVLVLHDRAPRGGYYIGVSCEQAFVGQPIGSYKTRTPRAFPLVGPDLAGLEDGYDWILATDLHRREVSVKLASTNCGALGAIQVTRPKRGSHYKVHFPGRRCWTLDVNVDPVPERFLRELVDITSLPYEVIKSCLLEGRMPERRSRLYRGAA